MEAQGNRCGSHLGTVLALTVAVSSLSTGCGTFPKNVAGQHPDCLPHDGLQITLIPVSGAEAVAGQPLLFDVTITNAGSVPVSIPKEPFLSLKWRYPNGSVDGKLPPDSNGNGLSRIEAVRLAPGESLLVRERVETHNFRLHRGRLGVVEFRAGYCSKYNQPPGNPTAWEGNVCSNTYGILVAE